MKTNEFVRNPYNFDWNEHSDNTGLLCQDESKTSQEFVKEADINFIADTYMRTGLAPRVLNLPTAGDFEGIFDFQSAMNTIAIAKQEFNSLPAKLRARFGHDPAQLLDFINDPDNRTEAEKLGLIRPKEPQNAQGSNGIPQAPTQGSTGTSGTQSNPATPEGTQSA